MVYNTAATDTVCIISARKADTKREKFMETKPKTSTTPRQTVVVEVSPEEYQADLRRGLAEDETLAPGRHVFRRGAFLRRHANESEGNKESATSSAFIQSLLADSHFIDAVARRVVEQQVEYKAK